MAKYLIASLFLLLLSSGFAENEAYYRSIFAKLVSGKEEVTLADKTRCDVVTDTHAIEVEFANKWTEGLGQSLWYAFQTDKKAGIVLILKDEKDRRFLIRLQSLIRHRKLNDVTVWTISKSGQIDKQELLSK
ncbi:hypothetical protein AAFN60_20395 [Roseibacillus persicicus]|uniref:hypothetical protein n=1 Tax=Roseibacillus persicicus TaxID=454148 RepID=UPI00398B2030